MTDLNDNLRTADSSNILVNASFGCAAKSATPITAQSLNQDSQSKLNELSLCDNQSFLLELLREASNTLPITVFKKEIDGKERIQVFQGESHIQGASTAISARELRKNFPVKMLEGLKELPHPLDSFLVKSAKSLWLAYKYVPKMLPKFLSKSGITEEINKVDKLENEKQILLEKGYRFSLSERLAVAGVALGVSCVAISFLNLAASVPNFIIGSEGMQNIGNIVSKTTLAGMCSALGLSLLAVASSYILKERKYVGDFPFTLKVAGFILTPLCGRRNQNFVNKINEFWDTKPEEDRAIATCGFIHLYGCADAMEASGWTYVDFEKETLINEGGTLY